MQLGTRTNHNHVDLIAMNRLFASCNRRELAAVRALGTVIDVEPGRVLLREGETAAEFYIVLMGEASVTGGAVPTRIVGPGQFFGELELLDWGPRASTAAAVTPMRLLVFTRVEFRALLSAVPSVAYIILRTQAERLRSAQTSIISLAMLLHPASWIPGDPTTARPTFRKRSRRRRPPRTRSSSSACQRARRAT